MISVEKIQAEAAAESPFGEDADEDEAFFAEDDDMEENGAWNMDHGSGDEEEEDSFWSEEWK